MRKIHHGWKKETMGECAKTFMESLTFYHYGYSGKYREEKIKRLIEQYHKIYHSVLRGLNYYEKPDEE